MWFHIPPPTIRDVQQTYRPSSPPPPSYDTSDELRPYSWSKEFKDGKQGKHVNFFGLGKGRKGFVMPYKKIEAELQRERNYGIGHESKRRYL